MTKRNELVTKRAEHIAMLRGALAESLAGEKYGAAANFAKQVAELEGLLAPDPPSPPRRKIVIHDDPVKAARARLLDVMEMRVAARAKGSLDSAARLIATENELQRELATATRAAGATADEAMSDDDLVRQVADEILSMPPVMRRAVLALVHGGTAPVAGSN